MSSCQSKREWMPQILVVGPRGPSDPSNLKKSETPPPPPKIHKNEANVVGHLFRPVILSLKFLGYCPLSHFVHRQHNDSPTRLGKAGEIKYGVVIKSWFFPWCLAIAILFNGSKIGAFLGSDQTEDAKQRLKTLENLEMMGRTMAPKYKNILESLNWAVQLLHFIMMMMHVGQGFFSWTESSLFAKFLNNWTNYEANFSRQFPSIQPFDSQGLKRRRNLLAFLFVLTPSLVMILLYSFGYADLVSLAIQALAGLSIILQAVSGSLLEDLKVMLTYEVVASAFLQIKKGITGEREKLLTPSKMKEWRGLVRQVREQAVLAGDWQKNHQLFLIGSTILLVTGFAFMVLCWTWLPPCRAGSTMSFQGLVFIFILVGRIYLKILAADKIKKNELLVVQELESMDQPSNLDSEMDPRTELKLTCDMMRQNPCQICFGDYVTLNKGLLLGIFSQVVTYLIVVLQFAQSRTSK